MTFRFHALVKSCMNPYLGENLYNVHDHLFQQQGQGIRIISFLHIPHGWWTFVVSLTFSSSATFNIIRFRFLFWIHLLI